MGRAAIGLDRFQEPPGQGPILVGAEGQWPAIPLGLKIRGRSL